MTEAGEAMGRGDDGVAVVPIEGEVERALTALADAVALFDLAIRRNAVPLPEFEGEDGESDGEEWDGGEEEMVDSLAAGILAPEAELVAAGPEGEEDGSEEPPEADMEAVLETIAAESPRVRNLLTLVRMTEAQDALRHLLLRRVVEGDEFVPDTEMGEATARMEAAIVATVEAIAIDPDEVARQDRDEALGVLAGKLREQGLDGHDVDFQLAEMEDGRPVAVWHRIPAETASVWLLEGLYARVEASLATDPLLELERRASRWWFLQWSAERRGEEFQFTQGVREQEWSLVDRPALVTDVPVMSAFHQRPEFDVLSERRQALVRALERSFVGIFSFRGEESGAYLWESLLDGRTFPVHEHNREEVYPPGSIGLGRLIPWEGGLHLRSPGMVILSKPDAETGERLADTMRRAEEAGMFPAIALEAMISMLLMGARVPRRLKPAESRAEARELAQALPELFERHGLSEEVVEEEIPEDMRARAPKGELKLKRYRVDEVMGDWMQELQRMAGPPGGSSDGRGGGRKEKGGKKGKKGKKGRR
jgi:hypothetical protein